MTKHNKKNPAFIWLSRCLTVSTHGKHKNKDKRYPIYLDYGAGKCPRVLIVLTFQPHNQIENDNGLRNTEGMCSNLTWHVLKMPHKHTLLEVLLAAEG